MKHLSSILLLIACLVIFPSQAQTPYDAFAPETSRPMLGLEAVSPVSSERTTAIELVSGSAAYTIVIDPEQQSVYLLNLAERTLLAVAPLTDDILKWLSVDPLSDKYPSISPYAYCNWNPVKFVDPDGKDIYRYSRIKHKFIKMKDTNDNYDQVGKFRYSIKQKGFVQKTDKEGNPKFYSYGPNSNNKIAKGILGNGFSMWRRGVQLPLTEKSGLTKDDIFNFALLLDKVTGVEISGIIFRENNEEKVYLEPYKDNESDQSYNHKSFYPPGTILHFHTHGHASHAGAMQPSTEDKSFRDDILQSIPNIIFLILHNYENSPFDYTKYSF